MTTADVLREYEALRKSGFSEEQARALLQFVTTTRTDPELVNALQQIHQRLGNQERTLADVTSALRILKTSNDLLHEEFQALKRDVHDLKNDNAAFKQGFAEVRADLHVVEERVKMEGRVSRMINATLIALGAIGASMAAVFGG